MPTEHNKNQTMVVEELVPTEGRLPLRLRMIFTTKESMGCAYSFSRGFVVLQNAEA